MEWGNGLGGQSRGRQEVPHTSEVEFVVLLFPNRGLLAPCSDLGGNGLVNGGPVS
jgi:hypothetical protein